MSNVGAYRQYDFTKGYEVLDKPDKLSQEERQTKETDCDASFGRFEDLRGRIIGRAIAVESAVASVVCYYFCPLITRNGKEGRISLVGSKTRLNREFLDIVLSDRSCTFEAKIEYFRRIMKKVGIPETEKPGIRRVLQEIAEDRNRVAHARVGIDFDSARVRTRDSREYEWRSVPDDFEKTFRDRCKSALKRIQSIGCALEKLQIEGDPRDITKF